MAFTDDDLKGLIAAATKTTVDELPAYWDDVATRANAAAFNLIRVALLKRGFTAAQVNAWDSLDDYRADLALWSAFTKYAVLEEYDQKSLATLDRRKELVDVDVTVGGVLVAPPDNGVALQVGVGDIAEDGVEFRRRRDQFPDRPGWVEDRSTW